MTLPMTQDYTALEAELRKLAVQIDPLLLGGPDARLLNQAADAIANLQRDIAELRADNLDLQKTALDESKSRASAEAEAATLRARLEAVEALLKRAPPALNDAFAAGIEEQYGGSTKRQARHLQSVEALRNDIRAALQEPQT